MNVFDLQAILTLDSSQYDNSLASSEKKASGWGQTMKKAFAIGSAAVAATGAIIVKGVNDVAAYGDQVDKMSQKLGLSTDAYQKWDYVLQISGTDMQSTAAGLKTLTNKLDDAKNGSSSAQEAFSRVGLSLEDIQNMSQEEIFEATVRGLAGMEEGADRAAIANDLLGRSGQQLAPLFNLTNEEIDELLANTEEYGMIMGEDAVKASAAYQDALTTLKGTLGGVKNTIMSQLLPALTNVINGATEAASGIKKAYQDEGIIGAFQYVGNGIKSFVGDSFIKVRDLILQKFPGLANTFKSMGTLWNTLSKEIGRILSLLQGLIKSVLDAIMRFWNEWGSTILSYVGGVWKNIQNIIQSALKIIQGIIKVVTGIISGDWKKVWEGIKQIFSGIWNAIKNIVSAVLNTIKTIFTIVFTTIKDKVVSIVSAIRDKISNIFASIRDKISSVVSGIRDRVVSTFQGIRDEISSVVTGIKDRVSNVFSALRDRVSSTFQSIKEKMTSPIRSAKETIDGLVQKVKNIFPLSIGRIFSNLKIPHISISGGSAPFGIGGFGTRPSISVEWYKKAYKNAYEFDYPTTMMGLGDGVGSEYVVGKSYLMDTIGDAVESRIGNFTKGLEQVLGIMEQYFPQFANMQMVTDTGAMVGQLAPAMDRELGRMSARRERG